MDCLSCTAGSYCQSYGLSEPTGRCDIGYYCPGGQDSPTPNEYACSPGHFCYQGSHNQTGCPSGDYQPHWGQGDCDTCPAGSYCKAFGKLEQFNPSGDMLFLLLFYFLREVLKKCCVTSHLLSQLLVSPSSFHILILKLRTDNYY